MCVVFRSITNQSKMQQEIGWLSTSSVLSKGRNNFFKDRIQTRIRIKIHSTQFQHWKQSTLDYQRKPLFWVLSSFLKFMSLTHYLENKTAVFWFFSYLGGNLVQSLHHLSINHAVPFAGRKEGKRRERQRHVSCWDDNSIPWWLLSPRSKCYILPRWKSSKRFFVLSNGCDNESMWTGLE